jgi:multisubunit Na+/H+ antiporter MnhC subunit
MTEPPFTSPSRPSPVIAHPFVSAMIVLLIVVSICGTLIVPIYNTLNPKVGGFPFFYFYLIVYMPVVAIMLGIVIRLQKRLGTDSSDAGEEAL